MTPIKRLIATPLACLLTTAASEAAFTYLDAVDGAGGNTTLANGDTLDANDGTGATTWRQRDNAAFGSGPAGSVFEGVDPSPEIKTTISGLTPGATYTIHVHFWDPQSTTEDWNVSAGLTTGSLTTFTREAGAVSGSVASVLASTLSYDVAPTQFGPNSGREMLAGLVGNAVADGGGNIEVFIDDFGSTDVNQRTWYDGVSHELVPEPSVALLGAFGLLGLLRRRR